MDKLEEHKLALISSLDKDTVKNKAKTKNQAVLVAVIQVENYNYKLSSNYGLTSITDGNVDITKGTYGGTTVVSSHGLEIASDVQDRSELHVGDYIRYVPGGNRTYSQETTAPQFLKKEYTGYTADQSLTQEYTIWKILNIDGSRVEIIPAFKDTGVRYTNIYFSVAKGFNNAPYVLDSVCSYLYSNKDKEIEARSIDYEDIIAHMKNETGKGTKKIEEYQNTQVESLPVGTDNVTGKRGRTITYKNNTWYPVLYPEVRNNLSSTYYESDTVFNTTGSNNGPIGTKPSSLEVDYTYYSNTIIEDDYEEAYKKRYSVIFGTGKEFWFASRCVYYSSNNAGFYMRYVGGSYPDARYLFFSHAYPRSNFMQIRTNAKDNIIIFIYDVVF